MDKKNKSKKTTCDSVSSSILPENNDVQKDGVLFKEIGFFAVILTALLYMSAYVCEAITAIYFGFDIDLISLPISTIIKNNIISLFIIISSLLPIIFDYLCSKKKPSKLINFKYNCLVTAFAVQIVGVTCFFLYKIKGIESLGGIFTTIIIAIFILLFILVLFKASNSKAFMQLFCYLSILFLLYFFLVGFIFFTFNLKENKSHQSFEYYKQNYILLRKYDDNIVAKKIISKESNGQKENCFDSEILFLPVNILEKGIIFTTINVEGNCKQLRVEK